MYHSIKSGLKFRNLYTSNNLNFQFIKNLYLKQKMSLDIQQVSYLKEECILVDEKDHIIGSATKRHCHLVENIEKGCLHRAFSVFLFNKNGQLLLQKRSQAKITYPGYWTNSCCSHPLSTSLEMDEKNNIGIKRAACRKLEHELGINPNKINIEDFRFLTRIHYKANNGPELNSIWGEHEIDYCLIFEGDVELNLNLNEVECVKWVTVDELLDMMKIEESNGLVFTPWFKLIYEHFLTKWWNDLNSNLLKHSDNKIHVF